jgi:hypothetical protein
MLHTARVVPIFKAVTTIFIASCAINTWAATCFDDKKLLAVTHQANTLVYVWSPRMVLSAQHAATAQQQALLQGLQFIAVHDAQIAQAEIEAARNRMAASNDSTAQRSATSLQVSLALCANTLMQRDALRHFPTAFVVRNYRSDGYASVHRYPVVGAMPEPAWASSLTQRMADRTGFEPLVASTATTNPVAPSARHVQ